MLILPSEKHSNIVFCVNRDRRKIVRPFHPDTFKRKGEYPKIFEYYTQRLNEFKEVISDKSTAWEEGKEEWQQKKTAERNRPTYSLRADNGKIEGLVREELVEYIGSTVLVSLSW